MSLNLVQFLIKMFLLLNYSLFILENYSYFLCLDNNLNTSNLPSKK